MEIQARWLPIVKVVNSGEQATEIASEECLEIARDSVASFISDLRALRLEHGGPTWETMAKRATARGSSVSRGSLNNAVNGDRLPSERTITAFVTALTTDDALLKAWLVRRTALAPGDSSAELSEAAVVLPRARLRRELIAALIVLVVTNGLTAFVVAHVGGRSEAMTDLVPVRTGNDPGRTICVDDAQVAGSSTKNPHFLIEVIFSVKCQAGWGRVTRYDNEALSNRLEVSVYQRSSPSGSTRQDAIEPDVQSAYTTLIVRQNPTDRLCVTGGITTGQLSEKAVEPTCIRLASPRSPSRHIDRWQEQEQEIDIDLTTGRASWSSEDLDLAPIGGRRQVDLAASLRQAGSTGVAGASKVSSYCARLSALRRASTPMPAHQQHTPGSPVGAFQSLALGGVTPDPPLGGMAGFDMLAAGCAPWVRPGSWIAWNVAFGTAPSVTRFAGRPLAGLSWVTVHSLQIGSGSIHSTMAPSGREIHTPAEFSTRSPNSPSALMWC